MAKKKPIVAQKTTETAIPPAPIRVDVGCGPNKKAGFVGMDIIPFEGVDVVINAGKDVWPFEDGSVSEIHASHFVEHLEPEERIHFVNELYRVLKMPLYTNGALSEGFATIIVPHWASQRAYGDLTHCFVDDTDILTKTGWKRIKDVTIGEEVLVLDEKTGHTKYSEVINTINEYYIGDMLSFQTDQIDLITTPNHDLLWLSKDSKSSKIHKTPADSFLSLAKSNHHPRRGIARIDSWVGEDFSTIKIAEDEHINGHHIKGEFDAELLYKLLGWYISEGNVDLYGGHYIIDISQSPIANPEKYQEIKKLIEDLGFVPSCKKDGVRFNSKALALYLQSLGLSGDKYIPEIFKKGSKRLLELLIDTAIKGDGHRRSLSTSHQYDTTSTRLADDFQEICLKAGYRSNIIIEARVGKPVTSLGFEDEDGNPKYFAKSDMCRVGVDSPQDLWYPHPQMINYEGRIVCVTVNEYNNILVRRNGKAIWSGNCWPPVSEFWFYYLDKDWRAVNAPHTDSKYWDKGYNCHLQVTWGYGVHPEIQTRNQEYQQNALKWWKEACTDTIAQFSRKD